MHRAIPSGYSLRFTALLLLLVALIASLAQPASAKSKESYRNCYWDGSPPICEGRCRPGFVEMPIRRACLTGWRVQCCEPSRSRSGDSTDARPNSESKADRPGRPLGKAPCPPGKVRTRTGVCAGPGDSPCRAGQVLTRTGVCASPGDSPCPRGQVLTRTGACVGR